MPSSIPQWVVDKVFPGLSAISPQLLRIHSKGCPTSPRSDCPKAPSDSPTLPCEVLQNVFSLAMQPSCPDIDYKEKVELRSTILACAQVCWLWREAARGYSPLWVHAIDFQAHPPQVIHDILQLSRPHPIEIGHRSAPFRVTRGRDFVVLNLLKEDRPRIREWNIEILEAYRPLNYCRWIFGVAGTTEPRTVHTLRLTGSIVSPTGALHGLTSSLRKLCLRETNLNLSPYMDFTRLTELSVSSSTSPSVKYRLMEWLALLRRMPRLQFPSLKDAIKPGPEMDPIAANQPVQTVSLRQLKVLSLAESTWESAYPILALLRGPILQKPRDCGLILSLPSTSCLPAPGISLLEVTFALGLASISQVPQGMQTSTLTCPRLEMSLRAIRSGFDFTLGTVQDHERTLDWNGDMGTQGVNEYLNRYSKTASTSRRRPAISVTVRNPVPRDLTAVCTFFHPLFSNAKSLRITVEPRLCQSMDIYPVLNAIPEVLSQIREVEVVTLDEGALVAVLPMLQGRTYMSGLIPVPVLPNLQFLAMEAPASRAGEVSYHDISGVGTRSILRQYAGWRKSVGLPVDVFGCVAAGGREDGEGARGSRWKRQGMVAIPL